MAERYILMRHDPTGHNHEYLYSHSTVVDTVGEGKRAVDIVRTEIEPENDSVQAGTEVQVRVQFLARYQLGRLQSGMESRSSEVFDTLERARYEAQRVLDAMVGR